MQPRKKVRKLAAEELFEYSVKYLGVYACSSEELRARLRLRAAHLPDVETTIARLIEIGYLNDCRFAEGFAVNRVENNGFGRMRVLSDLRARRVPGGMAEKAVEQAFEGRSESELIDAYIERRIPALSAAGKVEDERKLAAAYRRLRRAGFSSGGVLSALKRLATRPELIDEPTEEEAEES